MVKNPTEYDPTNNEDKAIARRNVVLDRMAELNVISREKADRLKERDLGLDVQESRNGCVRTAAPFFCDYVLDWLLQGPARSASQPRRADHLLKTGGLTIRTTVDVNMQATADNAVRAHVFQRDQAIGALAVVEPGTGNVKAIAQSRPMGRNKRAGETYLNYVVPQKFGDSQCCQAGSTFKVFTLAAALEQGIPLNKAYNAPASMDVQPERLRQLPRVRAGRRAVQHRQLDLERPDEPVLGHPALGQHLLHAARPGRPGSASPTRWPSRWASTSPAPTATATATARSWSRRSPSVSPRVSPLEMAEAYATFAARGLHCHSRPVTEILDSAGNQIRDYASNCAQVMQQSTADAVNDVLTRRDRAAASPPPRRSTSRPPARPARRRRASRSGSSATPRSWPPPR